MTAMTCRQTLCVVFGMCAREVVRWMWYQSYDDLSGNEYDEYDELKEFL